MADSPRRRRAWMPRLSLRGWALIAAGVVLFLYGLFLERRDALFLGSFLLLVPVVAMAYVLLRRLRVHVSRRFSPAVVAAGSEAVVAITVANLSTRASYGARWRDEAERGIHPPESTLLPSLGRSGRPDEGDTARLEYTLTPRRRGVYAVGPLVLERSDPFGLATAAQTAGEPLDLVVTPRVTPLPGNALSFTSGEGSMHERLRMTNPNSDELIAREYRPGDPLRRMNWPATARHGELMVRQEEQRSNPEARLVLDTALSGSLRSPGGDRRGRMEAAFELAVEMAASVGIHLLDAGYRLDVIETGPSQLSPGPERTHGGLVGDLPTSYRVPAGDREFLEGLANLVMPELAGKPEAAGHVTGNASRTIGTRLPTFAVLVDPDPAQVRELAALRSWADPAFAFCLETVRREAINALEDAGWRCVPLRSVRSIADAWASTDRSAVSDGA